MAQFILFYVSGPTERPPKLSDEELQGLISEFVAWNDKLDAEGRLVGGARLTDVFSDPGRVCSRDGDEFIVTDGPLAETREVVGGYNVIEAASYDEAAQACKDHPALKGGRIVIRQLA